MALHVLYMSRKCCRLFRVGGVKNNSLVVISGQSSIISKWNRPIVPIRISHKQHFSSSCDIQILLLRWLGTSRQHDTSGRTGHTPPSCRLLVRYNSSVARKETLSQHCHGSCWQGVVARRLGWARKSRGLLHSNNSTMLTLHMSAYLISIKHHNGVIHTEILILHYLHGLVHCIGISQY